MKAFDGLEEMERVFDEGEESILDYADLSTLRKPRQGRRPPQGAPDAADETLARLDALAAHYGVTREALVRIWLVERLDQEEARTARRTQAVAS